MELFQISQCNPFYNVNKIHEDGYVWINLMVIKTSCSLNLMNKRLLVEVNAILGICNEQCLCVCWHTVTR